MSHPGEKKEGGSGEVARGPSCLDDDRGGDTWAQIREHGPGAVSTPWSKKPCEVTQKEGGNSRGRARSGKRRDRFIEPLREARCGVPEKGRTTTPGEKGETMCGDRERRREDGGRGRLRKCPGPDEGKKGQRPPKGGEQGSVCVCIGEKGTSPAPYAWADAGKKRKIGLCRRKELLMQEARSAR